MYKVFINNSPTICFIFFFVWIIHETQITQPLRWNTLTTHIRTISHPKYTYTHTHTCIVTDITWYTRSCIFYSSHVQWKLMIRNCSFEEITKKINKAHRREGKNWENFSGKAFLFFAWATWPNKKLQLALTIFVFHSIVRLKNDVRFSQLIFRYMYIQ